MTPNSNNAISFALSHYIVYTASVNYMQISYFHLPLNCFDDNSLMFARIEKHTTYHSYNTQIFI